MGDLATAIAADIKAGPRKNRRGWRRSDRKVGREGGSGKRQCAGRRQQEFSQHEVSPSSMNYYLITLLGWSINQINDKQLSILFTVAETQRYRKINK